MKPPLHGLRVLELAGDIAGQYLGQLLADQGADVLKIEPPRGGRWRGTPQSAVWNRNKRSAVADVRTVEGCAFVRDLAARCDVVIADFSPGEGEALGLDYETLTAGNPALVYAWLPPYGERGPYSDLAPDDALATAVAGMFTAQASFSGDPSFVTLPLASYTAALLAASAVCAALLARERHGCGQRLTVAWMSGTLALYSATVIHAPQRKDAISPAARARHPQGANPAYKLYKASDAWLFIACGNNLFFNKLCIALGRPELAADERFSGAPWALTRREDMEALTAIIAAIIAERPRDHWLAYLQQNDIPCAAVGTRREYMDDAQVIHNGLRVQTDDPDLGPVVMAGSPISFSQSEAVRLRPAPRLGAGTAPALQAWPARPAQRQASPATDAPPLDGIRVLDLSSYIAGAHCPVVLAEYGADVIKVESLEGDPFRTFGLGFLGWNRGKRAIALDLKSAEGLEIVYELARRADVVVENFRTGSAARLKVDYQTLSAINPNLIYCTVAGWGETGPNADLPVFDPIFQARSGANQAQGGDGDPVFLAAAITDYGAAYLAAYAVTAALYARAVTGRGQRAVITLTGAVMAMQSGEFIFPASGGTFGHETIGGVDFLGPSAAYRCYPSADGWLFLACTTEEHWHAMAKAIGRPELAYPGAWQAARTAAPRGGLADVIQEMLSEDTAERWLQRFAAQAVPAAPIVALRDVLYTPQLQENGWMVEHQHPQWGPVRQVARLAQMSRTPPVSQRAAPLLGEHTDEVLRELGYDEPRIAALRQKRLVL
jgi:crotonobetainyl-CoA:carnitine CoA-transferase CaiB-like acyl-CoA transferase